MYTAVYSSGRWICKLTLSWSVSKSYIRLVRQLVCADREILEGSWQLCLAEITSVFLSVTKMPFF
jgi:hypothetical protein